MDFRLGRSRALPRSIATGWVRMSDLDDLMAAFAGVNVDDHDELVETFARVLGTDGSSARFFLEASQWNLEVALGNFLDTVGSRVRAGPWPAGRLALVALVAPFPRLTWRACLLSRVTSPERAAYRGRSSRGTKRCSRLARKRSLRGSQSICIGSS